MNAKHQFRYTYNETDYEEFSPLEVTFQMPAEVSITQMLNNFEQYLRACGFFFDGKLAIVEDGYDLPEEELEGGCMADFDKECGCETTSSSLESKTGCVPNWDDYLKTYNEKIENKQKLKEWNEGVAKLDAEVSKNKWIHGMCNPPASDTTSALPKEYYDWLNKVKLG